MQTLGQKINDLQVESQMPGLQVVVTEGKEPVFEYVKGIRAQGHEEMITSEDKWHIGSEPGRKNRSSLT